MNRFLHCLGLVGLFFFAACSSIYVTVDATAIKTVDQKTVFVVPQKNEFTGEIERALAKAGYVPTKSLEASQLVVEFQYRSEWQNAWSSHLNRSGYDRKISLTAYETKSWGSDRLRRPASIWKTDIDSFGDLADLKRLFPPLLTAAVPYFGTNSNGQKSVRIAEDDVLAASLNSSTK